MKRKCHRSSTYPILLDWVQNLQNDELYLIKQWLKKTVPMIYNKKMGVGGRIYYLVTNDLGGGITNHPPKSIPAHPS